MANLTDNSLKKNRYPGIRPFSEQDNPLFFGRTTDLDDLSRRIFIRQTVVLYGKSGYGKSSLINAGIIPELKKSDAWTYFSIRFNTYSEKETVKNLTPVETVKKRFSESLIVDQHSAFFEMLPDENSFWYWIKQNQLINNKTKFIIFFDQFEELFTDSKEDVSDFSEQLAELLYGSIPVKYREKINEMVKSNTISDDLHKFIYEKPEIKVVFSIRADRLSLMNVLTDRHPTILQYHYELDALKEDDAVLAIVEPAKLENELDFKTPPFAYTPAAITKILKGIANPRDKKIEAATLQIVCRYVEDVLVDENKHLLITEDILGDVNYIFQQYYENTLNKLSAQEKPKAHRLIEDELTDGERRNTLTDGYIKRNLAVPPGLLNVLEQSSLLRKEIDASGRLIYEISHDSLLPAINEVAQKRRQGEEDEKKQWLEKQLEEQRLAQIKQQEEEKRELELRLEVEKQRSDELERLNARANTSVRMAIILAIVCLAVAFTAVIFKRQADKEKTEAGVAEKRALAEDTTARRNLYENNLLKASDWINKAEIFMKSNDYPYAKTDLKRADSLIRNPQIVLSPKVDAEKQQLQRHIISLLKNCDEKK